PARIASSGASTAKGYSLRVRFGDSRKWRTLDEIPRKCRASCPDFESQPLEQLVVHVGLIMRRLFIFCEGLQICLQEGA
ncbi:hypothetical protein, partial [Pseudobacteroides cellulosolvens]|uniref:hypothetical protein n=1 Tax=Pseudobacteroides cellulosolvens TaxID=35825 RepID=UPI001A9A6279